MKNVIICKQCSAQNPFYRHICISCKSYLRERVVNLDLWKVIGLLIENPVKGFEQIIYSEHKNFIVFIIMLAAIKLLLDSIFMSVAFNHANVFQNFFLNYLLLLIAFTSVIFLFSFILSKITKSISDTRVKDNFSVLTYSFIPHIFALVFLFPIELILFGEYLFSFEPSPFQLKETLAYALLAFETLVILWGLFLTVMGIYAQTKSIKYSLLVSIIFNLILYSVLYFFTQNIK